MTYNYIFLSASLFILTLGSFIDTNFAFVLSPSVTGKACFVPTITRKNLSLFSTESDDDDERALLEESSSDELQSEINKLVEDPPMFSSWNEENFDSEALPIPIFTASLVAFASISFTGYLYYIAIYGFPAPPTV